MESTEYNITFQYTVPGRPTYKNEKIQDNTDMWKCENNFCRQIGTSQDYFNCEGKSIQSSFPSFQVGSTAHTKTWVSNAGNTDTTSNFVWFASYKDWKTMRIYI